MKFKFEKVYFFKKKLFLKKIRLHPYFSGRIAEYKSVSENKRKFEKVHIFQKISGFLIHFSN